MSERRLRRPGAFTLLEVLVGTALMSVVLGAAYLVLTSGLSTTYRGMAYSSVLTGISDLTEHLFHDLEQMVVVQRRPGRRALRIAQDGRRLAFLVPRRDLLEDVLKDGKLPKLGEVVVERSRHTTSDFTVFASPVLYRLVPRGGGLFSPARGNQSISGCLLSTWSFTLTTATSGSGDERFERARAERLRGRFDLETDDFLMRSVMLRSQAVGAPTTDSLADAEPNDELDAPNSKPLPGNPNATPSTGNTPGLVSHTGTASGAAHGSGFVGHAEPLYLTIRFTAVDPERRVAEQREILWDLENARLVQFYRPLYALPDKLYRTFPPGKGNRSDP